MPAFAERGVRASVVRLPQVHGDGDRHGFFPQLIDLARRKGLAGYPGDGSNRWPAVHRLDAARLYRLALEQAAPAGARLHAVAEEGVSLRDLAEAIGRGLQVPVRGLSGQQAEEYLGWLMTLASHDNPVSSARTRELLGWRPVRPGLLADLAAGHYFRR